MWVFTVPHFGKLELKDLTLTLELRTELLFCMPSIDLEFFPFKKKHFNIPSTLEKSCSSLWH